ncbi:MAG: hypothetical protein JWM91_5466, partial [Rhodospirillales bacterium]|nr:hypothetical protein [Rhodospirillales bacterium]
MRKGGGAEPPRTHAKPARSNCPQLSVETIWSGASTRNMKRASAARQSFSSARGSMRRKLSWIEFAGSRRLTCWSSMANCVSVRTLLGQGCIVPVISASKVVLPEPFGPLTAMRSGPVMAKDRSRMSGPLRHVAGGHPVDPQDLPASGQAGWRQGDRHRLQDFDALAGRSCSRQGLFASTFGKARILGARPALRSSMAPRRMRGWSPRAAFLCPAHPCAPCGPSPARCGRVQRSAFAHPPDRAGRRRAPALCACDSGSSRRHSGWRRARSARLWRPSPPAVRGRDRRRWHGPDIRQGGRSPPRDPPGRDY